MRLPANRKSISLHLRPGEVLRAYLTSSASRQRVQAPMGTTSYILVESLPDVCQHNMSTKTLTGPSTDGLQWKTTMRSASYCRPEVIGPRSFSTIVCMCMQLLNFTTNAITALWIVRARLDEAVTPYSNQPKMSKSICSLGRPCWAKNCSRKSNLQHKSTDKNVLDASRSTFLTKNGPLDFFEFFGFLIFIFFLIFFLC